MLLAVAFEEDGSLNRDSHFFDILLWNVEFMWCVIIRVLRSSMGGGGRWDPMQVQYMKLGKKYFDSISIEIRNPLGQFMPFNSGRTDFGIHRLFHGVSHDVLPPMSIKGNGSPPNSHSSY